MAKPSNIIEFSIGPSDKENHDKIINWLSENLDYEIKLISYNGDHYSEIYVKGDYNKAYEVLSKFKTSLEHWED